MMYSFVESPYLVGFDSSWRLSEAKTKSARDSDKKTEKKRLKSIQKNIVEFQKRLYAEQRQSLLIIFQAMDAAGKDGTIRAVFSGINPQGCHVTSFKRPTAEELAHDYLWRVHNACPRKGHIEIFNRSHYEEVLITAIFPQILQHQQLPTRTLSEEFALRYRTIRNFEKHLADTGTRILKFWLNIGKAEQRRRLLRRMEDPERHWKHESGDLDMRDRWVDFMTAYETALTETSRSWAPWYAIPADDKPQMRSMVADIVCRTLMQMDPQYPTVSQEQRSVIASDRLRLIAKDE
ncbi:MAG: PPK2 family polyphosphate kinase [Myxococcota bacterium]|nr:PPK2 family polyphosphate kinase [Myxococcota bacterium]